MVKVDRTGEIKINKHGIKMTIIRYDTVKNIDVLFDDTGHVERNRGYGDFKRDLIKDSSKIKHKTDIKVTTIEERIANNVWKGMIERCQNPTFKAYKNVTICNDWYSFKSFNNWFQNNHRWDLHNKGIKLELDKDLLSNLNNKMYSPDTCIFIPVSVNMFMSNNPKNKYGLTGVSVTNETINNKYRACCSEFLTGKRFFVTGFATLEDAHAEWIKMKEIQLANVKKYMSELGYADNVVNKIFYVNQGG